MSPKSFLLGSAALALVGCSAPTTDQETAEAPDETVTVEVEAETPTQTNADGKIIIASICFDKDQNPWPFSAFSLSSLILYSQPRDIVVRTVLLGNAILVGDVP